MPIRAILFDKDGTLIDFQRTWGPSTHALLTEFAKDDSALFARLADVSALDVDAKVLRPDSPLIAESTATYGRLWAEVLGVPPSGEFFAAIDRRFFDLGLKHLHPVGEPKAVLTSLAAKRYRLGLVTNDATANARAQMHALGLGDLIGFIAGYDSGFGAKPDPSPVIAFAALADTTPKEVAVVGDSLHDLAAARAAGAIAVAVLSGPSPRDELAPHADVVLGSIADLPEWLARAG